MYFSHSLRSMLGFLRTCVRLYADASKSATASRIYSVFYVSKPTPIKHLNFYSFVTVKEVFSFVLATLGSLHFGKATHASVVLPSMLVHLYAYASKSARASGISSVFYVSKPTPIKQLNTIPYQFQHNVSSS